MITRLLPSVDTEDFFLAPFPVFRATGIFTIWILLFGVVVFVCDYFRVNHGASSSSSSSFGNGLTSSFVEFILDTDVKSALRYPQIFEVEFESLVSLVRVAVL